MRASIALVVILLAGCNVGTTEPGAKPEGAASSNPQNDASATSSVKTDPKAEAEAAAKAAAQAAAKMPQCSGIWLVGKKLPKDYGGCKEGQTVGKSAEYCPAVVAYEARNGNGYFTDKRRTIHGGVRDFSDDPEFEKVLRDNC